MVKRIRQRRQFTEAEKRQIARDMIEGYKKIASINSSLAKENIFSDDEAK
ncbi:MULTISPECIES: hypothetical protein [unclassified Halanaerobium]|nr:MULTISPECIES: hypothetical protein [unclassified Halanaerobium]RCW49269.1 hypothetical protein DFR78_10674 [Halanaerobium sp. MA284_MarDTE_T2]RCW84008.1 hypothetical protein DER71_11532 [Halanaerobium sp. DL-01]